MFYVFLLNLAALAHFVVIPVAGIVLLLRHRRDQGPRILAAGGCLLFVLAACLRAAATTVVVLAQSGQGGPPAGNAFHAADLLGLGAIAAESAALILVLCGVPGWRRSQRPPESIAVAPGPAAASPRSAC